MKLKKFEQFRKGVNEDLDPIESEYDSPDDFRKEVEEEDDIYDPDEEVAFDNDEDDDFGPDWAPDDEDDIEDGGVFVEDEDEFDETSSQGEEEGHEYEGSKKMRQLADELGVDVVNNQIEYDGKKINYYSETEKFHIGKEKFETVEEVLDFLNPGDSSEIEDDQEDLKSNRLSRIDREEYQDDDWDASPKVESMKYLKKFK